MTTSTKYELIQDVKKGELLSAYVYAPFDKGLEVLRQNNYELTSLEENARVRIQEGVHARVSKYGNLVKEDALYIPKKGKFITKFPIIANNTEKATQAHRKGEDFYLTPEQVEQSLDGAIELFDDAVENSDAIPTNRFGENELTTYIFGNHAENYGNFLKEHGIREMPVWLAYIEENPFARKIWFGVLGCGQGSCLSCLDRYLHTGYNLVRGVRKNSD